MIHVLFSDISPATTFITVPPVDTIGCYNGISQFYCESDRNDILAISWLINGNSITEQDKETHEIIINNDNSLSILGLPINNGIRIGCIIVVSTPSLQSEIKGAFFTLTEMPPPVDNVDIEFNDTLMFITWSPPSCIPVNHSYIVTITNDSTTVTNTTTELYYTIPVSPCSSNYTVNITVIDVGFTQYQSTSTIEYDEKNNTQGIYSLLLLTYTNYDQESVSNGLGLFFKFHKQLLVVLCQHA